MNFPCGSPGGQMKAKRNSLFTIGHSTRTSEEFIRLLRLHGVERVVDIRTIPKSRFNPQFNREALRESLQRQGIGYRHMKSLGGLRHPRPDSPNRGWRNPGFRGYADYMQSPEFREALDALKAGAQEKTTAIMCAEAVPWRCHRTLVADALAAGKWRVFHITGRGAASRHKPTPFMRIAKGTPVYPV